VRVFPSGVLLWGPGYPTADAAASQMVDLALRQEAPLILVEAVDFESAMQQLRAWPPPPA
jgi:hypothetical protein